MNRTRYFVIGFILTLSLIFLPAFCMAGEFQGKIVKCKGKVTIKNSKGKVRTPEASDYIAIKDEEINTQSGGKAVVKFTNGSMTVIGENSSLGIEKPTLFAHLRGTILFSFAKTNGPTRMVQTDSAVFGVRATSFIVDKDENGESLALKEGLVNVESPKGEFEIHKKKELDELNAYKAEIEEGVKDMKREGEEFIKQEQAEFVDFKKSFLLNAQNTISIKGNRVDQRPMDKEDKAAFDELEKFAGDHLKGFRNSDR
jgi:hypothetical protein